MRFSPSCGCCDTGDCFPYTDQFNDGSLSGWTEEAGNWTEETELFGYVTTSDSYAQLIFGGTEPFIDKFSARIPVEQDRPGRIIFAWEDTDNFWFAEAYLSTPSGFNYTWEIAIGQVVSGVETVYATDSGVESAPFGFSPTLTVCYRDGDIRAFFGQVEAVGALEHTATLPDGAFGLGTGDLTGYSEFRCNLWNLWVDTRDDYDADCGACPEIDEVSSSSSSRSSSSLSSASPSSASSASSSSVSSSSESNSSLSSASSSSVSSSSASSVSSSGAFTCCTPIADELIFSVSTVAEDSGANGPCCTSINGSWSVPLTSLSSSLATYEDTFENFCDGLDLHVYAEIRGGGEDPCEIEVTFRVLSGATQLTLIGFGASLAENTNCAALVDFPLTFAQQTSSGSMACTEPTADCLATAV